MASFLSAVGILGTASEAYQCGIQFITLVGGYCIAFPLAAYVYMPVFYKLRLNSAHEYLEMRFGKLVRWTASLVFLLQMTVYIALALYAPALAFSQVVYPFGYRYCLLVWWLHSIQHLEVFVQ
ncbi:Sodium-coupled monocarboxylate transporter 1, variant 3 [Schistosoma haematobium]|uniref:Sodium-coupled monocarboxylate transporter 1, variant 3 n=1 Tax=Schistosoma haematobium TaxID=6185 RepID=A0A922S188_SCHHA|nr:Sodium-coupled monocarboxylate transporter 1, variant 3 [Schistosoma haematobium]KAH9589477.1 Sodium-coupled monocarboxylate transporter 1, variant 3 [Schistosoma haematobium]